MSTVNGFFGPDANDSDAGPVHRSRLALDTAYRESLQSRERPIGDLTLARAVSAALAGTDHQLHSLMQLLALEGVYP